MPGRGPASGRARFRLPGALCGDDLAAARVVLGVALPAARVVAGVALAAARVPLFCLALVRRGVDDRVTVPAGTGAGAVGAGAGAVAAIDAVVAAVGAVAAAGAVVLGAAGSTLLVCPLSPPPLSSSSSSCIPGPPPSPLPAGCECRVAGVVVGSADVITSCSRGSAGSPTCALTDASLTTSQVRTSEGATRREGGNAEATCGHEGTRGGRECERARERKSA